MSTLIPYTYAHVQTEATTGYFGCQPPAAFSFSRCWDVLPSRPYDDFLRIHMLGLLTGWNMLDVAPLLDTALEEGIGARMALLLEASYACAALAPLQERIVAAVGDNAAARLAEHSSLVILRWAQCAEWAAHRQWTAALGRNLQEHKKLGTAHELGLAPFMGEAEALALAGRIHAKVAPVAVRQLWEEVPQEHAVAGAKEAAGVYQRPPAEVTSHLALERLLAAGLPAAAEMRHEASLSPIALLRQWTVDVAVQSGRQLYTVQGLATNYGRGLSVADARVSCVMEMVERSSMYLSIKDAKIVGLAKGLPDSLLHGSFSGLQAAGHALINPDDFCTEVPHADTPLYWVQGHRPDASLVYVPLQMVSLFCNLDEQALSSAPGSTGIATGNTLEEAKVAALTEVLERDAEATTPFQKKDCFLLQVTEQENPLLAALLADYARQGIQVQFQDITGPLGVPVFKCFVMSPRGQLSKAFGAGLSAQRALVSALTETPYPYQAFAAQGVPSGPALRRLPVRQWCELPDYSLASAASNLALLEGTLVANGLVPVYVQLTREDLQFPVVRALVPHMEPAADFDSFSRIPPRLYAAYARLMQEK